MGWGGGGGGGGGERAWEGSKPMLLSSTEELRCFNGYTVGTGDLELGTGNWRLGTGLADWVTGILCGLV